MCGIFLSLSNKQFVSPTTEQLRLLQRRGPDSCRVVQRKIQRNTKDAICYLTICATVLSLRGDTTVEQPIEDDTLTSLLCWNGEAWTINGDKVGGNDAQNVFDLLTKAARPSRTNDNTSLQGTSPKRIADALSLVSGPFAFLFHDATHQQLYFGRDVLGRRSLVTSVGDDGSLFISSTSVGSSPSTWDEVEANGIFYIDIASMLNNLNRPNDKSSNSSDIANEIQHIPWHVNRNGACSSLRLHSPFERFNKDIPSKNPPQIYLDSPAVRALYNHLKRSLDLRVRDVRTPPSVATNSAHVGILFSGGLDCALLARICHEVLPHEQGIDLLNVAFENPRVLNAAAKAALEPSNCHASAYSLCPDRLTGLSTYRELLAICPGRKWRFVSIDIPYSETMAHRSDIVTLMRPHNTEMDLSIATALYFAARGVGNIQDNLGDLTRPYSTTARVLLSGLGADEIFAGYTRHSTAFRRLGYKGLVDELELDVSRLGQRNLGRDDRVISHWSKEARYPYLDEELLHWALELPVWEKCGFREPEPKTIGSPAVEYPALEPAKLLLRLLAWSVGMKKAASEKKRAIQFGARTAKMEAGKTKGTRMLQ